MKTVTSSVLILLIAMVVGCGAEESRTVTDGADLDAIRQYEESIKALESQQSEIDMEAEE